MEQKHSLRFSDNVAASDHNTVFALDINSAFGNKLHNPGRRTGKKIIIANHNFSHILRVKSVNVLFRRNCVYNRFFVNMLRQRKLNQYSVDFAVAVKTLNQRFKLLFGGVFRKCVFFGMNPDVLASLFLVVDVNSACRVVADNYYCKSYAFTFFFQTCDFVLQLVLYSLRNCFSVEYFCHFCYLLSVL